MVVVPASWLNVPGPDRISQQLSIRATARKDMKRSKECLEVAFALGSLLAMQGWQFCLCFILVSPRSRSELPGRSIQSREIGAALSVRTGDWLLTAAVVICGKIHQIQQLSSEKKVHITLQEGFQRRFVSLSKTNLLRTEMFVLGVETTVWQLPKPLFHSAKQTSCVGLSGRASLQNKSAGKLRFQTGH